MSLSFISACYGRYDTIKAPVEQEVAVDEWILVTDEADIDAPGWTVVHEPRPHLHPNVAAKVPKFRPDLYVSSDTSIWIDASAIIQPTLAGRALEKLSLANEWAMFPHPQRTRITDEVKASRGLPKYDELDLEGQVQHYIRNGYTNGESLWATGVIARKFSERDVAVGDAWLTEVCRWGFQDQLSFSYVKWKFGMKPTHLGADLWSNDIIWFLGHGR